MAQKHGVYVYDEGDLRKYRTEIPNIVDDMNLSPHAYRLYGHLKRVAGAKEGSCWQNTDTLAQICNMSTGMVSRAKAELVEASLIVIGKKRVGKNDVDDIRILDIWPQNFAAYNKPKDATPSQENLTPSQYEPVASVTPSQYETKKEPTQEGTNKEKHIHIEKPNNGFSRVSPTEHPQAQQPSLSLDGLSVPDAGNDSQHEKPKKPRTKRASIGNPNTIPILDAYLAALGYQHVVCGEDRKAAKLLADAGYLPEQVTVAYGWLSKQEWWREQPHISLMSLVKQIGGILQKLGKSGANGTKGKAQKGETFTDSNGRQYRRTENGLEVFHPSAGWGKTNNPTILQQFAGD